eukprot:g837.t1
MFLRGGICSSLRRVASSSSSSPSIVRLFHSRNSNYLLAARSRWYQSSGAIDGSAAAQDFMNVALTSLKSCDSADAPGNSIDDATISIARGSDVRNMGEALRLPKDEDAAIQEILNNAPDPFELVADEIDRLANDVKKILGSKHKVLETVAQYFFQMDSGKKLRPVLVLLMSAAINRHHGWTASEDESVTTKDDETTDEAERINPKQRRLAEITEMIHTASLLHDDVLDMADTRRGAKSVNVLFGNKLAVLAGDFLLARASVCLARLRNLEVVETLSTVIEHLVKGEILQMKGLNEHIPIASESDSVKCFADYTKKNYYKTGSLIANASKSASILSGVDDPNVHAAAFDYGVHFGTAFQLIDDILDFEGTQESMGKEPLADLRSGITTAPVLFAQRKFAELTPMIARKFEVAGDVEATNDLVVKADACAETRSLAEAHAALAMKSMMRLRPSPERDALMRLMHMAVYRKK